MSQKKNSVKFQGKVYSKVDIIGRMIDAFKNEDIAYGDIIPEPKFLKVMKFEKAIASVRKRNGHFTHKYQDERKLHRDIITVFNSAAEEGDFSIRLIIPKNNHVELTKDGETVDALTVKRIKKHKNVGKNTLDVLGSLSNSNDLSKAVAKSLMRNYEQFSGLVDTTEVLLKQIGTNGAGIS